MARFERLNLGLQTPSGKGQIPDHVEQFMPATLIREAKLEVVEIAFVIYGQSRDIKQGGQTLNLLIRDRMLYNDYGVIHIAPFNEIVLEKVLYLMEEDKGPAIRYLPGIIDFLIPMSLLHPQDSRPEIHCDVD